MFLTMFKKKTLCSQCILVMFLVKRYFKQIEICNKSYEKIVIIVRFFNNLLTNTPMVTILYYKSMNIVNPNHF